jgi:hypothetical protein
LAGGVLGPGVVVVEGVKEVELDFKATQNIRKKGFRRCKGE